MKPTGSLNSNHVFPQRIGAPVGAAILLMAVLLLNAAEKFSLPPERDGFKRGPGAEIATAQCLLCHSADYVSTQPPLSRAAWKASVQKMRDKYGAPMPEDKVEPLAAYLAQTYGSERRPDL